MPRCTVCQEPLFDSERRAARVCIICAHRTMPAQRESAQPLAAGVIDNQ